MEKGEERHKERLTPGRKAVNLQWELLQYRHRFIGVMHLEEGLTNARTNGDRAGREQDSSGGA